jgi:hypothetical protein
VFRSTNSSSANRPPVIAFNPTIRNFAGGSIANQHPRRKQLSVRAVSGRQVFDHAGETAAVEQKRFALHHCHPIRIEMPRRAIELLAGAHLISRAAFAHGQSVRFSDYRKVSGVMVSFTQVSEGVTLKSETVKFEAVGAVSFSLPPGHAP